MPILMKRRDDREMQRNHRQVKGLAGHRHAVQQHGVLTGDRSTVSYADQPNYGSTHERKEVRRRYGGPTIANEACETITN